MSKRDLLLKILLPFLILVVAAVITLGMVKSRKMPQQEEREVLGPLVKVMQVATGQREIHVSGTGTVQPRREVGITPQVSGQIVEISPTMVVGGFFREGDLLFAIEDIDYQLALERARANLALAELELAKIAGQAEIARLEWQRLELPDKQE
ncbi:MAG: biotin/lipoyl-binding protein, partial [Desulfuromonadales bacterium]|nr:biotin/lipoyl-binding protein [Desulfuromonadales bacterium]